VKAALIWDRSFTSYKFRADHPFNPKRLELSISLIEHLGLLDGGRFRIVPSRSATDDELLRVHSPEYIDAVRRFGDSDADQTGAEQWGLGTEDNPIFPRMHEATSRVVGGTLRAAELVMRGEVDRAFAIAGGLHHAHRDRASGFCVYSDLAAAIAWIREGYNVRVLYIDYDAHHGDGVQGIFYSDPEVLTLSLHESGRYLFPGTGFIDELGEGEGFGYSLNIPMEPQTEDDSWIGIYRDLLADVASAFRPEVIVLQSGCDAHVLDPLSHLRCTTRLYEESVRLTAAVADEYCGGRLIVTGGGGYAVWRVVPRAWTLVWAALTGQQVDNTVPREWIERWQGESPCLLPERLRDPADVFPPVARRAEVEAINRRTLEALRRDALPLLRGWGLGF
jgi:acetoin utilization protein AcuC